jgi:metal transporter CNNM
LVSLDQMQLEILKKSGEDKEKEYAAKIIPLVKQHHLLLVTLLLSNALAMEALPIFLDRISSPVAAVLISVTGVLFFGEVRIDIYIKVKFR